MPTVTDADLVLGYLEPRQLRSAGGMRLDLEAARAAFAPRRRRARRLGRGGGGRRLRHRQREHGDRRARRHRAPRAATRATSRSWWPAAPGRVHAAAIAAELEVALLCVPRESSIFCAAGMLMCDFQHDEVRALKRALADVTRDELAAVLDGLAAHGRGTLHGEGVGDEAISFQASLDLRYVGQWHELQVPLRLGSGRGARARRRWPSASTRSTTACSATRRRAPRSSAWRCG